MAQQKEKSSIDKMLELMLTMQTEDRQHSIERGRQREREEQIIKQEEIERERQREREEQIIK